VSREDEGALKSGRTVIFVSHHMHSVALLCDSAAFLEQGRLVTKARFKQRSSVTAPAEATQSEVLAEARRGTGEYRFESINPVRSSVGPNEPIRFQRRIERRHGSLARFYLSVSSPTSSGRRSRSLILDWWTAGMWMPPRTMANSLCEGLGSNLGGIASRSVSVLRAGLSTGSKMPAPSRCPRCPVSRGAPSDSLASCVVLADYEWR
jgi:hypothetical protein